MLYNDRKTPRFMGQRSKSYQHSVALCARTITRTVLTSYSEKKTPRYFWVKGQDHTDIFCHTLL